MKKLITIMCCLLLAVTCVSFISCDKQQKEEKAAVNTYVTMDINPSIELMVDENNKVVSVYAGNEDAEVMLYGEEGIVNCEISAATDKILDLAVEYGYLTEENKGVALSVSSDTQASQESIESKIQASIQTKSASVSFDINVSLEDSFGIKRKLEEYKAQYPELTGAKLKLILSAMACDSSLTFDAADAMNNEELIEVIETKRSAVNEYCDAAYKKAVETYELAYQKLETPARLGAEFVKIADIKKTDVKYLAKYSKKLLDYATFLTAGYAIEGIVIAQETIGSLQVSEETAQAIATELGVDVTVLQDEDGAYTVASIEEYIAKIAKNAVGEEKAQLEAKYATLMQQLNDAEASAREEENVIEADILQLVKDTINVAKKKIEEFGVTIPDLTNLTLDDVKALSADMKAKADATYEEIMASLSEDELKIVKAAGDDAVAKLASKKAELDNQIVAAKADIEAKIAAKKEARKNI